MAYRLTFTNFTRWHSTSVHWSDIRVNTFRLIKTPEDTYGCFFVLHRKYTHSYWVAINGAFSRHYNMYPVTRRNNRNYSAAVYKSHVYLHKSRSWAVLCLLLSCSCQAQKGQSNNRKKKQKSPCDQRTRPVYMNVQIYCLQLEVDGSRLWQTPHQNECSGWRRMMVEHVTHFVPQREHKHVNS